MVHWLLGSAQGGPKAVAAIHGPRLERFLEKLVDTPVRGFVYEAAGSVDPAVLERGAAAVGAAARTWRIPVEAVTADPGDPSRLGGVDARRHPPPHGLTVQRVVDAMGWERVAPPERRRQYV